MAFTQKFLGKYILFNKNLLSWILLLARMWDAEFSPSTKQNRRSCKAPFARSRLKSQFNVTSHSAQSVPNKGPCSNEGGKLWQIRKVHTWLSKVHMFKFPQFREKSFPFLTKRSLKGLFMEDTVPRFN